VAFFIDGVHQLWFDLRYENEAVLGCNHNAYLGLIGNVTRRSAHGATQGTTHGSSAHQVCGYQYSLITSFNSGRVHEIMGLQWLDFAIFDLPLVILAFIQGYCLLHSSLFRKCCSCIQNVADNYEQVAHLQIEVITDMVAITAGKNFAEIMWYQVSLLSWGLSEWIDTTSSHMPHGIIVCMVGAAFLYASGEILVWIHCRWLRNVVEASSKASSCLGLIQHLSTVWVPMSMTMAAFYFGFFHLFLLRFAFATFMTDVPRSYNPVLLLVEEHPSDWSAIFQFPGTGTHVGLFWVAMISTLVGIVFLAYRILQQKRAIESKANVDIVSKRLAEDSENAVLLLPQFRSILLSAINSVQRREITTHYSITAGSITIAVMWEEMLHGVWTVAVGEHEMLIRALILLCVGIAAVILYLGTLHLYDHDLLKQASSRLFGESLEEEKETSEEKDPPPSVLDMGGLNFQNWESGIPKIEDYSTPSFQGGSPCTDPRLDDSLHSLPSQRVEEAAANCEVAQTTTQMTSLDRPTEL